MRTGHTMRGPWIITTAVLLVLIAGAGLFIWSRYFTDAPPPYIRDDVEHFKYGSIGAEVNGFPYTVWKVLPNLCSDKLPGGYASLGFMTEPGRSLPVGISVRKYGIERVGLNCAACHTTTINGGKEIILGAPAVRLDLERYSRFLIDCGTDQRFTPDHVIRLVEEAGTPLPFYDRLLYRYYLIGRIRDELMKMKDEERQMAARPQHGPGRTDAGTPWRRKFGLHPEDPSYIGTVDFPSIWNQKIRKGFWFHWDGNNNSLDERNLSAAMAGGATEDSLDHESIQRVAAWLMQVAPPRYPFPVDAKRAAAGRQVYVREKCGECHDPEGRFYGGRTPIKEIGTDQERWHAFTDDLLARFLTVGKGRSWQFKHYSKSNGYANGPLDGIWARAPYLHNGAVPTLWDLLNPPTKRPLLFYRGCDTYDPDHGGFKCTGPFEFDTSLKGNSNMGHEYGTRLNDQERRELVEYLKLL